MQRPFPNASKPLAATPTSKPSMARSSRLLCRMSSLSSTISNRCGLPLDGVASICGSDDAWTDGCRLTGKRTVKELPCPPSLASERHPTAVHLGQCADQAQSDSKSSLRMGQGAIRLRE
jgi:hypothetical protein